MLAAATHRGVNKRRLQKNVALTCCYHPFTWYLTMAPSSTPRCNFHRGNTSPRKRARRRRRKKARRRRARRGEARRGGARRRETRRGEGWGYLWTIFTVCNLW
jgi:hypothetical protein